MSKSKLYIVTCVFNPHRYKTRIKLYNEFKEYVQKSPNAELITVELAFGKRPFDVTNPDNPNDMQFRTFAELWHKERLLNLAINRLPYDWRYVAWIDADVTFSRPDWVNETIQLLQHYPVLQMFSQAVDLTPNFEILKVHQGIIDANNKKLLGKTNNYDSYHPGFAWAARRDALQNLGCLLDTAILGSGDRHMALSLLGILAYRKNLSPGYIEDIRSWHSRAKKYIRKNVGCMPGVLMHYWHGKKVDRRYGDRWKILIDHQFDPNVDLKMDTQGLWQLTDRCPQMHYDMRNYFRFRNEDSIDV